MRGLRIFRPSRRWIGILASLAYVAICILLAESGGAPTPQTLGAPAMCAQSQCHTSFPLNSQPALLTVTGFPSPTYVPGAAYEITVSVANSPATNPASAIAGFAAYVARNGNAPPTSAPVGTIEVTDSGTRMLLYDGGGAVRIPYVTHNFPRGGSPSASFTFRWTAPSSGGSDAVLVVASNSANGNGQNTGDIITRQTFSATAGSAACTYSLDASSASVGAAGGAVNVGVTAGEGCAWTAASADSFITVSSGASGTGNGAVTLAVAANTASAARTGTATIAGQTFTVNQAGGGQPQNERAYFAQFGNGDLGGGQRLTSTMIFVNPSPTQSADGTVQLTGSNGAPLSLNINGSATSGSFSFEIPPQGIRFFSTDGTGSAVTGSAQLTSTIPLSAVILFASPAGTTGVGAVQPLARFQVPIEAASARGVDTGVAVANPTDSSVDLILTLRDINGSPIAGGSAVLQLGPRGQAARFPRELFPSVNFASFNGTVEVSAPVPVNGMAIRTSPGQFSTLPVAEVK